LLAVGKGQIHAIQKTDWFQLLSVQAKPGVVAITPSGSGMVGAICDRPFSFAHFPPASRSVARSPLSMLRTA
jgi:hypothetical protein